MKTFNLRLFFAFYHCSYQIFLTSLSWPASNHRILLFFSLHMQKSNNNQYQFIIQTLRCPSRMKRAREISFSSFENYNSKSESRNQSPSIAVESILQLSPKNEQTQACLYSIHKKYLQKDGPSAQTNELTKCKIDDHPAKQNIGSNFFNSLRSKVQQCNNQEKRVKLIQYFHNRPNNNLCKTPLKDKTINQNQVINKSANDSNMSPIQAEQNQTPLSKSKIKRSISALNLVNQDNQYEKISSESYNLLSQRYLNSTRTIQSEFSHQIEIQNQIAKLQRQIKKLQRIKDQMRNQQNHFQQAQQSKITEQQYSKNKIGAQKKRISFCSQKQNETLSLSFSRTTGPLIKSQIMQIKQKMNEENIQTPRLLRKFSTKAKKTQREAIVTKQIPFVQQTNEIIRRNNIVLLEDKQSNEVSSQKQTQQLLQALQQQIKFDEILRKSKKWFKKWSYNKKWQELIAMLRSQNISMNEDLLKGTFSLSSQEQSPFYTPKDSDFTVNDLVFNHIFAQNNWKNYIIGKYSTQMLKRGSFTEQNLDISKRGEVRIEDLVRYINFELDKAYRNRDIFLIFNRLSQGKPLYFTALLKSLSKMPF